jgi:MFS family permease
MENYLIFVLAAIIGGTSDALQSGNDNALMHDTLNNLKKKNKFHNAFGKLSSIIYISLGFSAFIGGAVAEKSYIAVFILQIIFSLIATTIALFFVEPKRTEKSEVQSFKHFMNALKSVFKNKRLRNFAIARTVYGSSSFAFHKMETILFQSVVSLTLVGLARALKGVFSSISYWFSGKLIDRFGYFKVLMFCLLIMQLGNMFSVIFLTVLTPFIIAFNNIFSGVIDTSQESLFQKEYSDRERATMGSIISLFGTIFFSILSVLMGYIADRTSISVALVVLNLLAISVVPIYFKELRNK